MNFGRKLRGARKARGLSQAQVGSLVGVTGACVGTWERCEALPRDADTVLRTVESLSPGADVDRLGGVARALAHARYALDVCRVEQEKAEAEQRPDGFWRCAERHLDEAAALLLFLVRELEGETDV